MEGTKRCSMVAAAAHQEVCRFNWDVERSVGAFSEMRLARSKFFFGDIVMRLKTACGCMFERQYLNSCGSVLIGIYSNWIKGARRRNRWSNSGMIKSNRNFPPADSRWWQTKHVSVIDKWNVNSLILLSTAICECLTFIQTPSNNLAYFVILIQVIFIKLNSFRLISSSHYERTTYRLYRIDYTIKIKQHRLNILCCWLPAGNYNYE